MDDCISAQEDFFLTLKQSSLSEGEVLEGPAGVNQGSHLSLVNYVQDVPVEEDAQTVFVDCPSDNEESSDEQDMQIV